MTTALRKRPLTLRLRRSGVGRSRRSVRAARRSRQPLPQAATRLASTGTRPRGRKTLRPA